MIIKITYKKQWGGGMHITCNKGRQAHYRRDLTPYRGQIAPRPFRPTLFNLKGTFYSGALLTLRCLLTHPASYPSRVAIFDAFESFSLVNISWNFLTSPYENGPNKMLNKN